MCTPRIEIQLDGIRQNARTILNWFEKTPINILPITKMVGGCPLISKVLHGEGFQVFADSRIENIQRIVDSKLEVETGLMRIPHPGEANRVLELCWWSTHSQLETLKVFSGLAHSFSRKHGILLMVELGDLREGVLPEYLPQLVDFVLGSQALEFKGIAVNLACFGGILHDQEFLNRFLEIKGEIENRTQMHCFVVSYGNSAVLRSMREYTHGGINQIRVGEALFLGTEPGTGEKIRGLENDVFQIYGTVLECYRKPLKPFGGNRGLNAFGERFHSEANHPYHVLLDLGRLDTHPNSLWHPEFEIMGGSSDYLVLRSSAKLEVGMEIGFQGSYEAVMRAMNSPFVKKVYQDRRN